MLYRALGKTGRMVSQLGFGAMRLPMNGEGDAARVDRDKATAMIRRGFELGINYIDTATMYGNGDSQPAVGEALKGWRDKVTVSTKNPYFGEDEKEWFKNLETSLKLLDVQFIDVYHHHGVNKSSFFDCVMPRVSKWMIKARDQGLIKHIACSFHDNNDTLKAIVESGYPEVITLQYNMLDRALEPSIALAHEKNIGVIVMGPVAGGRLGFDSEVLGNMIPGVKRLPELALRFVLANPNISIALSGMTTLAMVEENAPIASDGKTLTAEEIKTIEGHLTRLKAMADLYCTGCGYCKPCPSGVEIQNVFNHYNQARVYGMWEHAKKSYDYWHVKRGNSAEKCIECGECEPKCPQKLDIRKQLKEAHAALTS